MSYSFEYCEDLLYVNRHSSTCLDGERSGGTTFAGRVTEIARFKSGRFEGEMRAVRFVGKGGGSMVLERRIVNDPCSPGRKTLRDWCPTKAWLRGQPPECYLRYVRYSITDAPATESSYHERV